MNADADAFADLLRQARTAKGLSQEALAEMAGISVRAVSNLERGVNQAPRKDTLDLLAHALDLSTEERRAWDRVRRRDSIRTESSRGQARTTTTRLPPSLPTPLTDMIGRDREVAEIERLLDRHRLVTLTGPGGIGKTRLAIAVAHQIHTRYRDGVAFVALASVRDASHVAGAIAQVLSVRETAGGSLVENLTRALAGQHLLVVLDNFEHVMDAAPLVSDLLHACASLTVLVTTREVLRIDGEREFAVPPLAIPEPELAGSLAQLAGSPAIALFLQRGEACRPELALTPGNADAILDICRHLDGLPLAIELAAARLNVLTPAAIQTRLANRLTLLTGGRRDAPHRQQTLSATIAWSYDLLTTDEQALFRRLAVFVGGFTLDAAEAVASAGGGLPLDVLDGISSLVEKNLLQPIAHAGDEPRYTMLETIHEFGLDKLAATAEHEAIQDTHSTYFANRYDILWTLFSAARDDAGKLSEAMNELVEHELSNFIAAYGWASTHGRHEFCLQLAIPIAYWWGWAQGNLRAADELLERALVEFPIGAMRYQIFAHGQLAHLSVMRGDVARSIRHADVAVAMAKSTGQPLDLVMASLSRGIIPDLDGDDDTAWQWYMQVATSATALGNSYFIHQAHSLLADIALRQGNIDVAREQVELAIAHSAMAGKINRQWPFWVLTRLALLEHDLDNAIVLAMQSLEAALDSNLPYIVWEMLPEFAEIAVRRGSVAEAVRLLAAIAGAMRRAGARRPQNYATYEALLEETPRLLSEQDFARCWSEGETWNLDQAVDAARAMVSPVINQL